MDVLLIALCALLGVPLLAWAVASRMEVQAEDETARAATLVLTYNQHAKKRNEVHKGLRDEITKLRRELRQRLYQRSALERLGSTVRMPREVRELRDRIAALQEELLIGESELDHYHVLIREELDQARPLYPQLIDALKRMLS